MRKLIRKIISYKIYHRYGKKQNLLIYDDIYPHPSSGFRLEEITQYLTKIENSKIITDNKTYSYIKSNPKDHHHHLLELKEMYPNINFEKRYEKRFFNINTKLFYCIFLQNIWFFLSTLEKKKIPFVFTLYPGGGFVLNNNVVDEKLKKIFSSPYFRKVIVTQKITYNYLIEKQFCKEEDIVLIFGCVVPQISITENIQKIFYPERKQLNIVFCAHKYSKFGEDKGYPLFIDTMKILTKKYDFLRFHVIGSGFTEDILDVKSHENFIKFHGAQPYSYLKEKFSDMDIILSPNKSGFLGNGAFDGFPLGTLVEAGLNGVLVMSCDPNNENQILNQNSTYFKENEEIIIIQPDVNYIVDKIEFLITNPDHIKKIALNGREKFNQIYTNNYQIKPRLEILRKYINDDSSN